MADKNQIMEDENPNYSELRETIAKSNENGKEQINEIGNINKDL